MSAVEKNNEELAGFKRFTHEKLEHQQWDGRKVTRIHPRSWWSFVKAVSTFLLVATMALTAVIGATNLIRNYKHDRGELVCKDFAKDTGYDTVFLTQSFWSFDCYVNVDGKFIQKDNLYLTVGD